MVLVTGATGILGRVIVLELLKRGKTVRAAKRPSSNLQEVQDSFRFYVPNPAEVFSKIEWMDVDFEDLTSIEKALQNVDEVYHCAAQVSFNPQDRSQLFNINVEGTKQLLYGCENSQVQKFLYVSSIAVLDNPNDSGELDEDSDFNPKLDHSDYALSKHLAEMEVWRASAEGMNTVIINPGIIIGSGNWQRSSGTLFPTFERNSYTFSGGSYYVDVRDVAKIAVELMEQNHFGERFLIVAEGKGYAELGNKVRRLLGIRPAKQVPDHVLKVAPYISMAFGWLIPQLQIATRSNIEAVTSFKTMSNQKVISALDYHFIPVEQSVDFHLKNYIADTKNGTKQI